MKARKITLLSIFLFAMVHRIFSQSLGNDVVQKIDQLFNDWNKDDVPGCAIGIIRNDSLIYSKGFGMANLETELRNTPQTIYQTASISKQFTAYAIILLAKAGKTQFR